MRNTSHLLGPDLERFQQRIKASHIGERELHVPLAWLHVPLCAALRRAALRLAVCKARATALYRNISVCPLHKQQHMNAIWALVLTLLPN
jgi:hypothetical protein